MRHPACHLLQSYILYLVPFPKPVRKRSCSGGRLPLWCQQLPPSIMHDILHVLGILTLLVIFHSRPASSAYVQKAGILITSPPVPQPTDCPTVNILKRQGTCSYGACGTVCLSQGAFCCGPAGISATSPFCKVSFSMFNPLPKLTGVKGFATMSVSYVAPASSSGTNNQSGRMHHQRSRNYGNRRLLRVRPSSNSPSPIPLAL